MRDAFTEAYLNCALWSMCDDSAPQGGDPLDDNYSVDDISPDTLAAMEDDCRTFQRDNGEDITSQEKQIGDEGQAGHDFWLTRNGHGSGFWDGYWSQEAGDRLTKACYVYGGFDLYVGDDGLIHS